jgi:squalene synthase HpnC
MTSAHDYRSGKGDRDENFPVASVLIAPRHRPVILAYYRFARAADDIADHETLSEHKKLAFLDRLEATLLGRSDAEPDALPLRDQLKACRLSPRHALDLLVAFRQDVTKRRYATWEELLEYCRYSASPVGRFVLDVHGESDTTWDANDALCTALQVINHLQDCGKDYRTLDRIYIPQDTMAAHGASAADLNREAATPALLASIHDTATRCAGLLPEARRFSAEIKDTRLGIEVAVITRLAERLNAWLLTRDPLSEPVHMKKPAALALATRAAGGEVLWRIIGGAARRARAGGIA